MKNITKIGLALAVVGLGALVVASLRRRNTKYMLERVADEGYETAHDILYPGKHRRGSDRLRYGVILPE